MVSMFHDIQFDAILVASVVWIVLGIISLLWVAKEYESKGKRLVGSSTIVSLLYISHFIIVLLSSMQSFWPLTFIPITIGWLLAAIGLIIYVWGIISMKSVSTMSGLKNEKLVTTGAFAHSRKLPSNQIYRY